MSPPPHQLAPCALSSSVPLQDEKNQVLITNAWLQLVGLLSPNTSVVISRDQCRVVYFWKVCLLFVTCGLCHSKVPALTGEHTLSCEQERLTLNKKQTV